MSLQSESDEVLGEVTIISAGCLLRVTGLDIYTLCGPRHAEEVGMKVARKD
jgi:hypothetical protein